MKSDRNGCSTCPNGGEQYEEYFDKFTRKNKVQYDYRTPGGKLFSTIAPTLDKCRRRKEEWLKHNGITILEPGNEDSTDPSVQETLTKSDHGQY